MTKQSEDIATSPSPDQRRVAAAQYERASQVLVTGNLDYGAQLLLNCCKLDPGNLIYRKALRKTQKSKHKNNHKGSSLAFLTNSPARTKLKAAKSGQDHLRVLECGEEILTRNPWDVGAQMDMAESAEALGFMDMALWLLEQARHKDPNDAAVNRAFARLCERTGHFTEAIKLWEMVRKAEPSDMEAQGKAKDLAATETIARGKYEAATAPVPAAREEEPTQEHPIPSPSSSTASEDRIVRETTSLRLRIDNDRGNPLPYLQLAAVYRRANLADKALAVLNEALIPTGNSFEVMIEIADLETEPFRRNLAITEDKIKARPTDEDLRTMRVRLLREINARELNLFREKAARYPTDMGNRLELGVRLLRSGQTDAAIIELQAARSDPRQRWRALQFLGYCFKSRKNWRLAARNFEEALQALPPTEENSRKELLFILAEGAAESGDLTKAIDLGYELANIDFGYRDIGRLLDEWQAGIQAT